MVSDAKLGPLQGLHLLTQILSAARFDCQDELACQEQIERLLAEKGVGYRREHHLSQGNIIDFYFPRSGLGLEVKVFKRWSKREVYRQVERYCSHDELNGLLLATAKAQGLPYSIHGKPVLVHQLGLSVL